MDTFSTILLAGGIAAALSILGQEIWLHHARSVANVRLAAIERRVSELAGQGTPVESVDEESRTSSPGTLA